jgi:DNA polymerase III alpha subunit
MSWEKEFLGLYISDHPFNGIGDELKGLVTPIDNIAKKIVREGNLKVAGVVGATKKIITKKGDPMLFVKLSDFSGNVEVIVFPKLYKTKNELLVDGKMLVVFGEITDKDDTPRVIANNIWEISQDSRDEIKKILRDDGNFKVNNFRKFSTADGGQNNKTALDSVGTNHVTIHYPMTATPEIAAKTKEVFLANPGDCAVFLRVGDKFIKTNFKIDLTEEFKKGVISVLGNGAI